MIVTTDTNVHTRCIEEALEKDPEHREANIQKYLLEGEHGHDDRQD